MNIGPTEEEVKGCVSIVIVISILSIIGVIAIILGGIEFILWVKNHVVIK